MEFPKRALIVLLKYARNPGELNEEVFDASIDVLKYVWHIVSSKMVGVDVAEEQLDIETALETAINEEEAKGLTPGIWITIGLWVVEKIIQKFLK
jgi:hypothetical protein